MFDYESLQGLEDFREVRLEPLPLLQENEQPLFRTAYSVTQTRHYCEGNHIEGVVLFAPNQETRTFRQIHFYQGHDISDDRQVEKPRVQDVTRAKEVSTVWFSHYAKGLESFIRFVFLRARGFKELERIL